MSPLAQLIHRIECATDSHWLLLLILLLVSTAFPVLTAIIVAAIWLVTWADTERYFAEYRP